MKGLLSANLRASKSSYVATVLAIALAVAFLLTCLGLAGGMRVSMEHNLAWNLNGADVVVVPKEGEAQSIPSETVNSIASGLGSNRPDWDLLPRKDLAMNFKKGKTASFLMVTELGEPRFDPSALVKGKRPQAGEIGIEQSTASALGVGLGDTLTAELFDPKTQGVREEPLQVSGIFASRPASFPSVYASAEDFGKWSKDIEPSLILLGAPRALSPQERATEARALAEIMSSVPGAATLEFKTFDEQVAYIVDHTIGGKNVLIVLALLFPVIAAVVAIIVVSVTYSVLLARRRRQLALLRAIGATKGQLRRLVAEETLLVGAIASAIGVLAGVLFAGMANLVSGLVKDPVAAFTAVSWPMILGSFLAGVAISFLAGFAPARVVAKVTPIEALADENTGGKATKRRVVRTVMASLLFVGGTALMIAAVWLSRSAAMEGAGDSANPEILFYLFLLAMFSGVVSFIGLLLLVSVFLPYLTAGLGKLSAKSAVVWRLAVSNTRRNPRRTGATGAALTLGVTLVVLLLTGAASTKATAVEAVNNASPIDFYISATTEPLMSDGIKEIARVENVARTRVANGVLGSYTLTELEISNPQTEPDAEDFSVDTMLLVEQTDLRAVARAPIAQVKAGEVGIPMLSKDYVGKNVEIRSHGVTLQLKAALTPLSDVQLNPRDFARLLSPGNPATQRVLYLRVNDGISQEKLQQVASRIQVLAGDGSVVGGEAPDRAMFEGIIEAMMWGALAMLGVSILVALVGVANTLALSVLERRREHGLLRAVGMTRGRLGSMLSVEALLIGAASVAIGMLAGIGYAIAGVMVLPFSEIATHLHFVVPSLAWGAALATVAVALLASLLPARAAGRVTPVEALAHD
ncbi:MAG: ABC transporter permease [Mobiluncus porci]|uniref:ABC transporter permease n=1 Tax=Mobiluncus porci TaxID=2652278 RepID=UPI0023F172EF|nr:ABC transporter permease [Mobiluncus porci]MDD7540746.1 ABC transporter permease [Mobiluncus porci]MDY5748308.1 ABC transporter permease [Mobiluncus porci]